MSSAAPGEAMLWISPRSPQASGTPSALGPSLGLAEADWWLASQRSAWWLSHTAAFLKRRPSVCQSPVYPIFLAGRYPGIRLQAPGSKSDQAPCWGIVPSTLRDGEDYQSLQMRAVVCRCLPRRRLSLSCLLCKATIQVYGWRRSLFSGVRVLASELPRCLVDMCPLEHCVAGTAWAPWRMASGFSHWAQGAV